MPWNRRSKDTSPLTALQQAFDAVCVSYPLRQTVQRDSDLVAELDAVVLVATGGARSELRGQRTKAWTANAHPFDQASLMGALEEPYVIPEQVDHALRALDRFPVEQLSTEALHDLARDVAAFRALVGQHQRVPEGRRPALRDAITATVQEINALRDRTDGRHNPIGKTVRLDRAVRDVEAHTSASNPLGYSAAFGTFVPVALSLALALDRFAVALARHDNIHLRSHAALAEACTDGQAYLDAEVANFIAGYAERVDQGLDRLTARIERAITAHQSRSGEILKSALEQRDAGHTNTRGHSRE